MRGAVTEVVQSSTMDCGPAALSSLLRSHGAPGDYDALRDLCATDVDGTTIGSLAAVAGAAGCDAAEIMVPLDHLLACPDLYLPAIGVTLLPDGFTHFVVLWRRTHRGFEVMDPAVGRRHLSTRQLTADLYQHVQPVSAAGWREWAGSDAFLLALDRRLRRLGVKPPAARALVSQATGDPGTEALAALDAAVRATAAQPGGDPLSRIRALIAGGADSIEDRYRSCVPLAPTPADDGADPGETSAGEPLVELRGVVLVKADRWDPASGDPGLLTLLDRPAPRHWQVLAGMVPRGRALGVATLALAAVVSALAVAEAIVLERLVARSGTGGLGWTGAVLAATAAASILAVALALRAGRAAELGVRRGWWEAVSSLSPSFTRTRPASDLAERGHLLHRIRELPVHAGRAVTGAGTVVAAAAAIVALQPPTAAAVGGLLVASVIGPVLAYRSVAEIDLRARTISGTLTRFTIDALVGGDVVAGGRAAASISYEHERSLLGWRRATLALVHRAALAQGWSGVLAAAAVGAVVSTADAARPSEVLVIALLGLLVIDGGRAVAGALTTLPTARSLAARVAGPLTSLDPTRGPGPADAHGDDADADHRDDALDDGADPAAVGISLGDVTVANGGTIALDRISLLVEPGEHVAVVGASGAGKSTLLDLVLGLVEPSSGEITWSPQRPAPSQVAWVAPGTRLWNDTIAANVDFGTEPAAAPAASRLSTAGIGDLAARLAARPDARLGSAGGMVSDGEAQRVRVARALGRPAASLVVLDEPFRGLEAERRRHLLARLRETWARSTVLCATHDLADTLGFDQVIILDHGRIVAHGPPDDLLADPHGPFARLVDAAQQAPWAGWQVRRLTETGERVR